MRRALSVVAAVAALASVGGCASGRSEPGLTKVLMIGNSFSISCLQHLPKVAESCGVGLDLASLYIGGCSMERHWSNIEKADGDPSYRPYRYDRYKRGSLVEKGVRNIQETLASVPWDIVTIQQASHESIKTETFSPFGDKLVATIRKYAPQAKVVVQETWSYTPWDKRLAKWGITQDEMYAKLHAAYGSFAKGHGFAVIPMGTAVQEWRRRLPVKYTENSFGGDVVGGRGQAARDRFKRTADNKWVPNCDVFHLNGRGAYLQALVWAAALFDDVDFEKMDYRPDFVTEADAKLMREIAVELGRSSKNML